MSVLNNNEPTSKLSAKAREFVPGRQNLSPQAKEFVPTVTSFTSSSGDVGFSTGTSIFRDDSWTSTQAVESREGTAWTVPPSMPIMSDPSGSGNTAYGQAQAGWNLYAQEFMPGQPVPGDQPRQEAWDDVAATGGPSNTSWATSARQASHNVASTQFTESPTPSWILTGSPIESARGLGPNTGFGMTEASGDGSAVDASNLEIAPCNSHDSNSSNNHNSNGNSNSNNNNNSSSNSNSHDDDVNDNNDEEVEVEQVVQRLRRLAAHHGSGSNKGPEVPDKARIQTPATSPSAQQATVGKASTTDSRACESKIRTATTSTLTGSSSCGSSDASSTSSSLRAEKAEKAVVGAKPALAASGKAPTSGPGAAAGAAKFPRSDLSRSVSNASTTVPESSQARSKAKKKNVTESGGSSTGASPPKSLATSASELTTKDVIDETKDAVTTAVATGQAAAQKPQKSQKQEQAPAWRRVLCCVRRRPAASPEVASVPLLTASEASGEGSNKSSKKKAPAGEVKQSLKETSQEDGEPDLIQKVEQDLPVEHATTAEADEEEEDEEEDEEEEEDEVEATSSCMEYNASTQEEEVEEEEEEAHFADQSEGLERVPESTEMVYSRDTLLKYRKSGVLHPLPRHSSLVAKPGPVQPSIVTTPTSAPAPPRTPSAGGSNCTTPAGAAASAPALAPAPAPATPSKGLNSKGSEALEWRQEAAKNRAAQQARSKAQSEVSWSEDWRSGGDGQEPLKRTNSKKKASGSSSANNNSNNNSNSNNSHASCLAASPDSWAAQQAARKRAMTTGSVDANADANVERTMKSILNKLTIERFEVLFQQLTGCGIKRSDHIEVLMREVFEKATTQHHFIGMYADLCHRLHRWFVEESPVAGVNGDTFKRVLLGRCQNSFEDSLKTQNSDQSDNMKACNSDEQEEAALVAKMRMLGNLKLIGALLQNGMLKSKVLVSVAQELLDMETMASLESLTVFLTSVGSRFDRPQWMHHEGLQKIFQDVQGLSKRTTIAPRIRFLLKDLLDLRASGWLNKKKAVRTMDGPTTLDAVQQQAEEALGAKISRTPLRVTSNTSLAGGQSNRSNGSGGGRNGRQGQGRSTPSAAAAAAAKGREKERAESFDKEGFKKHLNESLRELKNSLEAKPAADEIATWKLPVALQTTEITEILTEVAGWMTTPARCAGFDLVAELVLSSAWSRAAFAEGLSEFLRASEDLQLDIPKLQDILSDELGLSVQRLMDAGMLGTSSEKR